MPIVWDSFAGFPVELYQTDSGELTFEDVDGDVVIIYRNDAAKLWPLLKRFAETGKLG